MSESLNKVNKELKIITNQASFISNKFRNKIIKMLGKEFGIELPLDNYKSIDITIDDDGNIIMRDDLYKRESKLSEEEIVDLFENFKSKAEPMLKKNEINYDTMSDKNNLINLLILMLLIGLFIGLLYFAIVSFLRGDYFGCIWILVYPLSFTVPGIKDRVDQAFTYIKRKLK